MIEDVLSREFLRVAEEAAVESALTMGQGDRRHSDYVAVEAMRKAMDSLPMRGEIVIGEGERDEAPMLYIGEKVGMAVRHGSGRHYPLVDIAVDPLEGTNLCATGARIRLIGDGDLSAGISAAVSGTGVHALMGTGGAPEGVLTAAAMRCLNGEIFARLVIQKPEDEERCRAMGITDFKRIYTSTDLARGNDIVFAATGVTDGSFLKGVRFFGAGIRTSSLVMQTTPHRVRFIDSIQIYPGPSIKIRF